MATLYIRDLVIEAKHGVHEHEKQNSQRFGLTLELQFDTSKASSSDDLADTVDWSQLRQSVITLVESTSFSLIERLAQEVANLILLDARVEQALIQIDKLDAFESGVPGIRLLVTRPVVTNTDQ